MTTRSRFSATCDFEQRPALEHGAGRIVRIAHQQRFGSRRNLTLDLRGCHLKVVLYPTVNRHRYAAVKEDFGRVSDKARLRDNRLVARVHYCRQRQVQRLRDAHGDQQLGIGVVLDAVESGEVGRKCTAQLDVPGLDV
jgi:hypothetical protein